MRVLIRGFPSARIRPRGTANKFGVTAASDWPPHSVGAFNSVQFPADPFSSVTQCFLYTVADLTYYKSLSSLLAVYLLLFYSFTVCLFRGKERQRKSIVFQIILLFHSYGNHSNLHCSAHLRGPCFLDNIRWRDQKEHIDSAVCKISRTATRSGDPPPTTCPSPASIGLIREFYCRAENGVPFVCNYPRLVAGFGQLAGKEALAGHLQTGRWPGNNLFTCGASWPKISTCCPAAKMTDKRRSKSADPFFRFENLKKDLDKLSTGVSVHAMAVWQRLWCLSDSGLLSASLPAFSVVKFPPGMCWAGSAWLERGKWCGRQQGANENESPVLGW